MPRFRKPSLKTAVGLTKATKRAKKAVGITAAMKPIRTPGNLKRTSLRKSGYYSGPMRWLRFLFKRS
jgi:hypothetical protein